MNLPSRFQYRWDEIKAWFERIIYCHHNARVLADMEWRLSCVLDHCTNGMSKPYYSIGAMKVEIDDFISDRCKDAVEEEMEGIDNRGYQNHVGNWMLHCFGPKISSDKTERNHRFAEEAIELTQALGMSSNDWLRLLNYVYGRPVGEPKQEVGGVMVTLAALCGANDIDMVECGNVELARVWTCIDKIRAKQASKPKFGPLPGAAHG